MRNSIISKNNFDSIASNGKDIDLSHIKLFISDLDGTLLDSSGKMHPANIDAVKRLRSKGIKFSIATGRMMSAALGPLDGLEIDYPIITLNGCYVAMPEIMHKHIPDEVLFRVMPLFDENDATVVAMKKNHAYLRRHAELEKEALVHWVSNIEYVDILDKSHLTQTTELLVTAKKDVIDYFHNKSLELLDGDADIFTFPSLKYKPLWYSEIRAKDVNKGESLKALREHLGFEKHEVLIVGDYLNDIELFEEAGFAAAPSNALDVVKERAHYISPNSNDQAAVVEIINRFFE